MVDCCQADRHWRRSLLMNWGGLSDAIVYAGKVGGIEGKPRVIKAKIRRSLLERLTRGIFGSELDQIIHDRAVLRYELPL